MSDKVNDLISRRDFLQRGLAGMVTAGLFTTGGWRNSDGEAPLGRITASSVRVRRKPSFDADILYHLGRDEIAQLYESVQVETGNNPLWYRVWGGYIHSGYVQPVEFDYQEPIYEFPRGGCLFEVCVPYTRSFRQTPEGWEKNYRLYFNSTHWVTGIEPGPDGGLWYRIKDSYSRSYYAKTAHLRQVNLSELQPINPEVPRNKKWIEVSIGDQELWAYEDNRVVLHTRVSSGLPLNRPLEADEIPTETPFGDFHITVKTVSRHMGEKNFSSELDTGAYPGVPWVSFFEKSGYSLHGTYWHNNFGSRMSHGCVNMSCENAKWIYRWTLPAAQPDAWQTDGWGIRVSIRE